MGSIFRRGLLRSSISSCYLARMSTAPTESVISPRKIHSSFSFSSSPWLMLPPTYNDGISYNFYSLAENRVLTRPQTTGLAGLIPNPIHDLRFCGSSHGWIALFNTGTLDLFLYNPVSLEHMKLPPIQNLPNFPGDDNVRSVTKVILSCSPDKDEGSNCCAVMIYNCIHAVAFCCPGRSDEWTPIGKTHQTSYEDIAYSSRQNLVFGLNQDCELETWDLSYPSSPRMIKMIKTCGDEPSDGELPPKDSCRPIEYLVVADELFSDGEDDLLVVTRLVKEQVAPDGSLIDFYAPRSGLYPHMTDGFDIAVYDPEEGDLKGPLESLGDYALFVGSQSDSVALSATRFPELKPNSIYFSDPMIRTTAEDNDEFFGKLFGGHDIGIFDYETKTVSSCYYPCDLQNLKRVVPYPMWFFPTGPV